MRPHTAVTRLLAALALALVASIHTAPALARGTDPLQQTVGGDEELRSGEIAVIPDGHVDLGPRLADGRWTLWARDDRQVPAVWRTPEDTVFQVTDAAILPAPDDPDFAFLGVEAGQDVYVIPQVQKSDVVWLGWNTQDPDVVPLLDRGASLTLHGVDGPGDVVLFLQEGIDTPPHVLWNSRDQLPQSLWMEVNTHTHANWVFTRPGVYLLDVEVHADLLDGTSVSDRSTLRLAVGNAVDPLTALAPSGAETDPTNGDSAGSVPDGGGSGSGSVPDGAATVAGDTTGDPLEGEATTDQVRRSGGAGLLIGAAAGILGLALALGLLTSRRRRRAAEAELDHERSGAPGHADEPERSAR